LGGPQSRPGQYREVKILDTTGTRIPTPSVVQPLASHYTDCATAAHERQYDVKQNKYIYREEKAYRINQLHYSTNLKNLKIFEM
jgi:hypothetical protein